MRHILYQHDWEKVEEIYYSKDESGKQDFLADIWVFLLQYVYNMESYISQLENERLETGLGMEGDRLQSFPADLIALQESYILSMRESSHKGTSSLQMLVGFLDINGKFSLSTITTDTIRDLALTVQDCYIQAYTVGWHKKIPSS